MIGSLLGQVFLIAILVAFVDCLPQWLTRLLLTAAVLLPMAVFFRVITQPAVYRAWHSALRETWEFGLACLVSLWRCLSVRNLVRVGQSIVSLRVFPDSGDAWGALFLFPFKVYVVMAMPFLWLARSAIRLIDPEFVYLRFPEATYAISQVYVLCLAVLVVGALAQALFSRRGRSSSTVLVFLLGVVFFYGLRPWGMFGR